MALLLPLIARPFQNRTVGAKAKANAINASNELAHWNPNRIYMGLAANGKNAAKVFSPNATAAMALAAYPE